MIKIIFQKLLRRSGKEYVLDSRIPSRLIFLTLIRRFGMLFRGILKTGKFVFIGSSTKVLNSRNIVFGKNVTLEAQSIIDGFASEKVVFGDGVKIGAFSNIL